MIKFGNLRFLDGVAYDPTTVRAVISHTENSGGPGIGGLLAIEIAGDACLLKISSRLADEIMKDMRNTVRQQLDHQVA